MEAHGQRQRQEAMPHTNGVPVVPFESLPLPRQMRQTLAKQMVLSVKNVKGHMAIPAKRGG